MIRFAQPADFKTLYAEGFQPSGQRYSRMRHTVLKTGRSRTRPKTGIRLKKDSAVGMKPAKRHQKPYVSTSIPTIAHPHTTRPTPRRKNALPCTAHHAGQSPRSTRLKNRRALSLKELSRLIKISLSQATPPFPIRPLA